MLVCTHTAITPIMPTTFNKIFPTINTPTISGVIKSHASDFKVIEHHEVEFTEQGEHLWLKVEKTNSNTAWVATQLASACKVPARQVGFAGLKDRHAITEQWFSVQLPKIRDIEVIKSKLPAEITIKAHHWHQSKIKTGQLKYNEFIITIRHIEGDRSEVERHVTQVQANGVPNYFGPQRFGNGMSNIQQVQDWFAASIKVNNKNLRGLLISTARSHLFNLIVAHRIQNGIWQNVIDGDLLQLNNSHSWFPVRDATEAEVKRRLKEHDIHITAALYGEDDLQSYGKCAQLEHHIAAQFPIYHTGFKQHRVLQDRRSVRCLPQALQFNWQDNCLTIGFKLKPGCYATAVLREIINLDTIQKATIN